MPYDNKNSPHMSKGQKAKMESENRRVEEERRREREAEAERERERVEQLGSGKKDPPLIINGKTGRQNGHNCPQKDGATTHRLTQRCFDKGHAGACRVCKEINSAKDGCSGCGAKGDDLQYTNIRWS